MTSPGILRTPWFWSVLALVVFALAGYALFEARFLIEGPEVLLTEPRDGAAVAGPLLTISGTATNISFLSINGKQSFTDENGAFKALLSPPSGYTVVTVEGVDRFGRTKTRTSRITILNLCSAYA